MPVMQETCSAQREQLRLLQHQLAAANEKLKVMFLMLRQSHTRLFNFFSYIFTMRSRETEIIFLV